MVFNSPNSALFEPEAPTPQTFSLVPACLSELELQYVVNHQGLTCSFGRLLLFPPLDSQRSASACVMSKPSPSAFICSALQDAELFSAPVTDAEDLHRVLMIILHIKIICHVS